MGKLFDVLDGLRFLCVLFNMEIYVDFIVGLFFYYFYEIFEDVCIFVGYVVGEI